MLGLERTIVSKSRCLHL